MVNISNSLILFFNSCSLFISIPITGAGIIFALNTRSECQGYLIFPFIISGTFILAMSVFGVVGSYFRSNVILCIYLTILFVLISGLLTSTIFAFVVWSQVDDYSSNGYSSSYLKRVVSEKENWNKIQNCLKGEMMCRAFQNVDTAQYVYKANLTSIQVMIWASPINEHDYINVCLCSALCSPGVAGLPNNVVSSWRMLHIMRCPKQV